jgi:tetratricopeptide (TPR) repeat protein
LGSALWYQSKTKVGDDAERLFAQAEEKYGAAFAIEPNSTEVLYNWGTALSEHAAKTDAHASVLYARADQKFAAALEIVPGDPPTLSNWAASLMLRATERDTEDSSQLLERAWHMCIAAESTKPGSAAYNLACISALRGRDDDCKQWLQTSQDYKLLPPREHLLRDHDLQSIHQSFWFQEFVSRL